MEKQITFMESRANYRAARLLEFSLLFTFFIHGAAMLSMALLLLPGMPGGAGNDIAARAAYVGSHPFLWWLGWLPWQLTAASDLLVAAALVCTPWISKWPAIITVAITAAGAMPSRFCFLVPKVKFQFYREDIA